MCKSVGTIPSHVDFAPLCLRMRVCSWHRFIRCVFRGGAGGHFGSFPARECADTGAPNHKNTGTGPIPKSAARLDQHNSVLHSGGQACFVFHLEMSQ